MKDFPFPVLRQFNSNGCNINDISLFALLVDVTGAMKRGNGRNNTRLNLKIQQDECHFLTTAFKSSTISDIYLVQPQKYFACELSKTACFSGKYVSYTYFFTADACIYVYTLCLYVDVCSYFDNIYNKKSIKFYPILNMLTKWTCASWGRKRALNSYILFTITGHPSVHPSSTFCTDYPSQAHMEPGDYARELRAQGRG